MSDVIQQYYEKFMDLMFSPSGKIQVASDFHGQMNQISSLLSNDKTGLISSILEYMVHAGTVDINFNTENDKLEKVFNLWKTNINKELNIDIPRGLRSFTEQYFRERWKSSFIVVRIKWSKIDGFLMPTLMYVMDGQSIYAFNKKGNLNTVEYSFGKKSTKSYKELKNSEYETYIVRKPYNHWYDKYPTPYLVKKGALYHGIFKSRILSRQEDIINTALPYQFLIKVGTQEAIKRGMGPNKQDLQEILDMFKSKKKDFDEQTLAKGLAGAFPGDVNFEELIPDYAKILDEKILKSADKNILYALGMIEFKGVSSTREEAILNPKVLVEEVEDGVKDYVELLKEIVEQIKEKNKDKYKFSKVEVQPGMIKTFLTDDMKVLIRSWYDRGLVGYKSALENTTGLHFDTQVKERKTEKRLGLDETMYSRVIQNLEKDPADTSPESEDVPEDKKGPEANNYKNAKVDAEILEPMKTIRSIPNEIRELLTSEEQRVFKKAFNEKFIELTEMQVDEYLREKTSMHYASEKLSEYVKELKKDKKK